MQPAVVILEWGPVPAVSISDRTGYLQREVGGRGILGVGRARRQLVGGARRLGVGGASPLQEAEDVGGGVEAAKARIRNRLAKHPLTSKQHLRGGGQRSEWHDAECNATHCMHAPSASAYSQHAIDRDRCLPWPSQLCPAAVLPPRDGEDGEGGGR